MIVLEAAGYDVVLVETVGVGQSEITVAGMVDTFLFLTLARTGDQLQGIKKGILEIADVIAVNKADGDRAAEAEVGGQGARRRAAAGALPARGLGAAGADLLRACRAPTSTRSGSGCSPTASPKAASDLTKQRFGGYSGPGDLRRLEGPGWRPSPARPEAPRTPSSPRRSRSTTSPSTPRSASRTTARSARPRCR